MAGFTASEISRIECGYRDLSLAEARAIAKALGVSVHEVADKPRADEVTTAAASIASAPPAVQVRIPAPTSVPKADLADPSNFQELPRFDLLKQGDLEVGAFRIQLRGAVDRATKILHTSKVPAAIWREWREFEKKAQEVLRASASEGQSVSEQSGTDGRSAGESRRNQGARLVLAERAFRNGRSSQTRHQEKSYNALFLEGARKILPHDLEAGLTEAAELRLQRDGSVGFMRHFRNTAEETLPPEDLHRIVEAIQMHETGRRRGYRSGNPARSSFN